ncbi:efflux RND transporter periplasmic adaptor subunit [Rubinisphaera italica]|uniref:p-hydroxybenzoic acid efflux pump subunit AaeA n=1 Tax=Rubinisphaera italica TaxID=2527969 RepID=A0A5C5XEM5_9PLAN|nr:efflux RND transporter periplasmic adaptor subunit [Rubinisphaera italica]TWT61487.1 p-hydroxybenzoic acid efflux pump subunit AaeA [Rubinisphaera italica]
MIPRLIIAILAVVVFTGSVSAQVRGPIVIDRCVLKIRDHIEVSSTRAARIVELKIRLGNLVQKDDLLIQLDGEIAQANFQVAQQNATNNVEFRYAVKANELSQKEYQRAIQLNEEIPGARSQAEIEQLRLKAERSDLQVEQAQQHHQIAQINRELALLELKPYRIIAPISGQIVEIHKRVGEYVQPGEVIAEIVSMEEMLVEGYIPLNKAWQVRPGTPISGSISLPKLAENIGQRTSYQGQILLVDSTIDDLSQSVRFVGILNNETGLLRAGVPMKIEIHNQQAAHP